MAVAYGVFGLFWHLHNSWNALRKRSSIPWKLQKELSTVSIPYRFLRMSLMTLLRREKTQTLSRHGNIHEDISHATISTLSAARVLERESSLCLLQITTDKMSRLIAIMLGRLRMPVADCLHVYETLGNRIFGKPRFFTQISFGIIKRTKFKRSVLEDECRSIVSKRREISSNESGDATFPSDLGVCGT